MFRRLPTFLSLSFAATVGLFALTSILTAQSPTPEPTSAPMTGAGIKRNQEETLKLFKRFQEEVLRLAQRWEKSDNADDKERAKSLRTALKIIEEKGVEKMFKELIEGLGKQNPNGSDFNTLLNKDKKIIEALEQIIAVLETEDEITRIKKEIADLKAAIAAIQKLKRDQENLRAKTDGGKADPNRLAKDQNDLAKRTQDVADALDKKNQGDKGNPNAGNPGKQDPKAETKAEPKPGDNTGDAKSDTGEQKSDSKSDGMGMGDMGKPNAGEPKPSDGMGMGDRGKPNAGDKPTPMGGDPKAGDPKAGGEPKAGPPMGGDPMKPNGGKPTSADNKSQGSGKGDSKPSAGQPGGRRWHEWHGRHGSTQPRRVQGWRAAQSRRQQPAEPEEGSRSRQRPTSRSPATRC